MVLGYMGLGLFFIVGVASGVAATVVKLLCPPGDSGEVFADRLVRFVFPFRFAFGWELFFRVVFFIGVDGGLGNGKLSSLMVVLASSIPCHLWTGSADGRSAFVRESTGAAVRM